MEERDRTSWLEYVDAGVTLGLVGVLAWEATTTREAGPANVLVFGVLVVLLALRVRRGDWGRMGPWERALEVALLAVAVPIPANGLGPLRLVRLLRLPLLGVRNVRTLRRNLVEHGPAFVVTAALLTVAAGSAFVLEFERGRPGAEIDTLGDAAWWAVATMTTVGYGDLAPTTAAGRTTAVGLMVVGIALFGLMTALVAKWLVGGGDSEPATAAQLDALVEELRRLREG